jgi:carbonic anhydrase
MKKLVKGVVEFRKNVLPSYREMFSRLALGQAPDTLFIACSDSRVVPNLFASSDPGDLFVVRNVGNLIPCCDQEGRSTADESEAAAIEFALMQLNVSDIIVCGHSECGAMRALLDGRERVVAPHLRAWLRHGEPSLTRLTADSRKGINRANQLSKLNVLQQLEHLKSYPIVRDRIESGRLALHGWWFDLSGADVYSHDPVTNKFVLLDENEAQRILERLS